MSSEAAAHILSGGAMPVNTGRAQRRVLYAEDSTSSRIVTTAMLKRLGFIVDAVEDGELAVNLAKSNDYDLILLDVEMPVMDGVTAARCIRADVSRQAHTPILALSAFLADSTEHTIWRDAFDSALPKPANSNELLLAMDRAIALRGPKPRASVAPAKVNPLEPGSLLHGLKLTLPEPVFLRLMATAAEEMEHKILVIGSCVEGGDQDAFRQAAHALSGIAVNFDNLALVAHCKELRARHVATVKTVDVQQLFADVANWQAGLAT